MNQRWAVRLEVAHNAAVADLRLEPGIEVLESAGALWLLGTSSDERLDRLLRRLPCATRFEVLPDGQLLPSGKRLPCGRLPDGAWAALKAWAQVVLPVATFAARSLKQLSFGLERVAVPDEARFLLTRNADWVSYVTSAPQTRLERLTFAVSGDGRVLVRGQPLPPIPGQRFYEQAGMAVPCGWGWPVWLDPRAVRDTLRIEADAPALFSSAAMWESISSDQFVRATRSAVRLSAAAEKA